MTGGLAVACNRVPGRRSALAGKGSILLHRHFCTTPEQPVVRRHGPAESRLLICVKQLPTPERALALGCLPVCHSISSQGWLWPLRQPPFRLLQQLLSFSAPVPQAGAADLP